MKKVVLQGCIRVLYGHYEESKGYFRVASGVLYGHNEGSKGHFRVALGVLYGHNEGSKGHFRVASGVLYGHNEAADRHKITTISTICVVSYYCLKRFSSTNML